MKTEPTAVAPIVVAVEPRVVDLPHYKPTFRYDRGAEVASDRPAPALANAAATSDLMMCVPYRSCEPIGVRLYFGRPAQFDDAAHYNAWMREAVQRSTKLIRDLETGRVAVDAVPAGQLVLDVSDLLTEADLRQLLRDQDMGACVWMGVSVCV